VYRRRPTIEKPDLSLHRYRSRHFLDGFDDKVEELLDHIEQCIETHGASNVLVEFAGGSIRSND